MGSLRELISPMPAKDPAASSLASSPKGPGDEATSSQETRGGHSHRRRVYSCDRGQDVVKWSRHFFGCGQTVKQYSRAYIITVD